MSVASLNKLPEENPNPIMRLSTRGCLVYANKASQPLLRRWKLGHGEPVCGKARNLLKRALEAQKPVSGDFRTNGRTFTVTFTPILGSPYLNIYGLDTTEKKTIEISLRAALKEVRKLRNRLQLENRYLCDEIKAEIGFDSIIGDSKAQARLLHKIHQVAKTDATVLISGETGTGKELIARAIHANSRRNRQPLIKINCAALPTELIESELFGHEKGAFTGAANRKVGRFELAHGGTLFLDEIGDIPLESQSKLLRALQEQEFERLGGTQTIKIDVRVIAATNRVLVEQIAAGEFRDDLYYRLNVFPIQSTPLRYRTDDVAKLAHYFLQKYSKKMGKSVFRISDRVMLQLKAYRWPGNVRELENIIERGIILSDGEELLLDEAFDLNPPPITTRRRTLAEVEQEMIQSALEDCQWKIEGENGAASRLALAPSTLRERIKKYGLSRYPTLSIDSPRQRSAGGK